jgi:4-amino-4-deoxy-L-arabinose transferase-like glycosyltransferase
MAGPDRLTTSRFAPIWVLILALLSFWVGLAELPVQDRDEARYAQASRQMAETGDWVDIRFQTAARHVKPVGVYWMQAAVLEATGQTGTNDIRVHRIPSFLAGAFAALALIWAGTPLVGRRAAVLGGVMLATVYMLSAEARTAKTDATLLLTIILAMGAMGRAWLGQAKGWAVPAVFWTALAAGILVKGPVILLPVVTAGVWVSAKDRSLSWLRALRPLPGIGWMLMLTLPWFIAIMIRTEGAFLMASIGGDLAEKLAATGEHSGIPPGFYMLTVWATLWPWTLLLPLALVTGWTMRKAPEGAFLLGWIVPTWAVFEAVSTKLIHYTLPTYPALLLLAAVPLVKLIDGERAFRGWAAHVGTGGFVLGTLAFAILAIGAPMAYGDGLHPWSTMGGLVLTDAPQSGRRGLLPGRGDAGDRGARAGRDRDGLDPHRREPAASSRVLDHAADGGGDGDAHLPRDAPGHRRSHAAQHGVPVRHRYELHRHRRRPFMAGRGAGPRGVDRVGVVSRGHGHPARPTRPDRDRRDQLHQWPRGAPAPFRVAGRARPRRALRAVTAQRPPTKHATISTEARGFPRAAARVSSPRGGSPEAPVRNADQNRSFSITLVQAETKSQTNRSAASSWA